MLDLSYDEHTKTHDAPFQMKSNNGIYLIDDFGRQQVSPAELLNRWIIPMERRIDYLSLARGGKMTVPFEAFLIFSTNLTPKNLGDEAFLRRIQYKLHLKNPDAHEFTDIFLQHAKRMDLSVCQSLIGNLIEREYRFGGRKLRRCHARASRPCGGLHFLPQNAAPGHKGSIGSSSTELFWRFGRQRTHGIGSGKGHLHQLRT